LKLGNLQNWVVYFQIYILKKLVIDTICYLKFWNLISCLKQIFPFESLNFKTNPPSSSLKAIKNILKKHWYFDIMFTMGYGNNVAIISWIIVQNTGNFDTFLTCV